MGEISRPTPAHTAESPRPLSDLGLSDDLSWELLDAAPDGMVMTDEAGVILLVNRQTEAIFGYERAELLGRAIEELLPANLRKIHQAHRARYRDEPRTRAMGGELRLLGRRSDGSEFPVEVSLSPLRSDSKLLVVAAVRDVSERVAADAEMRRVHDQLRLVEDRERIGRDLHDIVVQRLFAAGMSLHAISSLVADRNEVVARVNAVVDELDTTIREIRTAIYGLQHSRAGRAGLRSEVMRITEEQRVNLGIEPRIQFEGLLDIIDESVCEHLLATLREALSNITRHAAATQVEISVVADDHVTLKITDNGVGIPDGPKSGHGLANMAARATELGGNFSIVNQEAGGTALEWRVPNTQG